MNSKNTNISELAKAILNSPYSDELCERFYTAYVNRDEDFFDNTESFPRLLLEAIARNSLEYAFYAFCGASPKRILENGLFMSKDISEEVEVKIYFADETEKDVICSLDTETNELTDFELHEEDVGKEISKMSVNFFETVCEVYSKDDLDSNDRKLLFWYDDKKWGNKNE